MSDVDALARTGSPDAIREEGVGCRFDRGASSSEMFARPDERSRRTSRRSAIRATAPTASRVVEGLRPLDHAELSRGLWDVRRVNGTCSTTNRRGACPTFITRKITRAVGADPAQRSRTTPSSATSTRAGLGLRARLHGRRLADAAGRRGATTTCSPPVRRARRGVPRGGVHVRRTRLARRGFRDDRSALLPPHRGRPAHRRLLGGRRRSSVRKPTVRFRELVRMMVDGDHDAEPRRALPVSWARDEQKLERDPRVDGGGRRSTPRCPARPTTSCT